jgi:hypothetical protein
MIIVYIIIGYLLITCIALICDIAINLLTMDEDDRENCETIGDFFNEIKDEIDPTAFIPIINIPYCIASVYVFLFTLFYKLYYIIKIKITVHWNKFLKIKIVKKKRKINQKEEL